MFIIQGLLNTQSLVLYGSKNRLKTCERFALLDPRILMRGARLTALLPFYRMRRLGWPCATEISMTVSMLLSLSHCALDIFATGKRVNHGGDEDRKKYKRNCKTMYKVKCT